MNITITEGNTAEKYIQSNKLILSVFNKAAYREILFNSSIGAVLIAYDLIYFDNYTLKLGDAPNITYYNLHLTLGFGICYIFYAIRNLIHQNEGKNNFNLKLREMEKRHFNITANPILYINDEFIKLDSDITKFEYKWVVITSYLNTDSFIFLIKDSNLASAIVIDKNQITETELNELLNYLSASKPESTNFINPI